MEKLDSYIANELRKINQTKEEYIKECKKCFLKQNKEIQEEIENADTDILIYEIKRGNWLMRDEEYFNALKYELMLRNDFRDE